MRLHPLHPITVHFPIACLVFTPLADIGALIWRGDWRMLAAWSALAGVGLGLLAAMFGALDIDRALKRAPQIAIAHMSSMALALILSGVSAAGRFAADFSVLPAPSPWALAASALALVALIIGGVFGGELVYGQGVGVRERQG